MNANAQLGIIFDMDGVLIDSAKPHLRSWQLLSEETGVAISPKQIADTFGRHNSDIIPRLFGSITESRLKTLADRKEELYRDLVRSDPPLVQGASSLIRDLSDAGCRIGIGSSGPIDNIQLVLSALGVSDRIDVIISGDDVTRGKPDPQVFALACEGLGLSPSRCVVIEDAPVGIQAAKSAGAKSIGICLYQTANALAEADTVVESLSDLSVAMIFELGRRVAD